MKEHEKTIVGRLNKYADAVNAGIAGPALTGRKVVLNFPTEVLDAASVQKVRKQMDVSQAVFASLLGVSTNTVQAWEQGVNVPSLMASRFMDAIRSDPEYWMKRLIKITGMTGAKPSGLRKGSIKKGAGKVASVRKAKA